MIIEKKENEYLVKTECKRYDFTDKSPLPTQINANGKDLLSSPIRIVCRDGDESFVMDNVAFYRSEFEGATFLSSCTEHSLTIVNAVTKIEEDGLLDVTLSVMPRGPYGMLENLGLYGKKRKKHQLNALYLEIPLKKEHVKFSHLFPYGHYVRDGETIGNDALKIADYLPEKHLCCGFKNQVLVLGDDCGVGLFFENDRDFVYGDDKKAFEIINNENEYVLRVKLIDKAPEAWKIPDEYLADTAEEWTLHTLPLSFRFGIQTLPIKKWNITNGFERNLHISCYDKNDYDYLWEPMDENSTEIRLDRIKRLGVKVLYVHETWNDFQNGIVVNDETAARLEKLVAACHERGIKIVPYFGYEISSLSPLFAKYGKKFLRISDTENLAWHYFRYPAQRDLPVCLNNEWNDIFFNGLTALQKKFNFDGFYLDGTVWPIICKNVEHGCGFYKDGELHGTHAVYAMREFMKKLHAFSSERGLIINVHPSGAMNLATLAYTSSVWDGEFFQARLLNGTLDEVPEPLLRTQYSGSCTGIPVFALCYSNPPAWNFRQALSLALPFGTLPKPNGIGEPLELMSVVWNIFEEYINKKAVFHPYYEKQENAPVSVSGAPHVKLSYYETADDILAIVCCLKKNIREQACITSIYSSATDLESGQPVNMDGSTRIEFFDFDFRLIKITKK